MQPLLDALRSQVSRLNPLTDGLLYGTADRGKTRIPSRALLHRNAFLLHSSLVAVLVCAPAPGLSGHPCKILRGMELETLFRLRNPDPILDAKCVLVLTRCFAHASW